MSPDVGDTIYIIARNAVLREFEFPATVKKVTPAQVVAVDPRGREYRIWRETYYVIGHTPHWFAQLTPSEGAEKPSWLTRIENA